MSRANTTLTSFGAAAARAIDGLGLDSRALFKRAALDLDALKNPNARYPDKALGELIRQAVKASRTPTLGLNIAHQVEPTTLHALGFSLLASQSLHAALLRLVRYYRIVSDSVDISLETDSQETRVLLSVAQDLQFPPELTDATLGTLLVICRWLMGDDFAPTRVTLQRSQPSANAVTAFSDFFKAPLSFSAATNSLSFDTATLNTDLPTSNAELAYHNDKIVADYLARFDSSRLSERVRTIFIERLVTGKFSEEQIAEQLNLSLRSMQRRLRDEQTSYQQLLDETRLELSLQYINRTSLTVAQIAPLLGFSDSSNFNRAFKRWLGISPSKYRALGFS